MRQTRAVLAGGLVTLALAGGCEPTPAVLGAGQAYLEFPDSAGSLRYLHGGGTYWRLRTHPDSAVFYQVELTDSSRQRGFFLTMNLPLEGGKSLIGPGGPGVLRHERWARYQALAGGPEYWSDSGRLEFTKDHGFRTLDMWVYLSTRDTTGNPRHIAVKGRVGWY